MTKSMEEEKIYAAFGLISIQFALLDEQIQNLLVRIIVGPNGDDFIGIMLFEDLMTEKKLILLKKLAPKSDEFQDDIEKIIKEAKRLKEIRNFLTHGRWTIHSDKAIEVTSKKITHKKIPGNNRDNSSKPFVIPGDHWSYPTRRVFKYVELKQYCIELEELNKSLEILNEKMDNPD